MPKTLSSPLCSQNVSFLVKIEGSFDENELEKSSLEKTSVFKRTNSDIACWASENLISRQKLFILKFLTMPKTVKGGPLKFFNDHSVAKFQKKIEGEPIEFFENFRKKNK